MCQQYPSDPKTRQPLLFDPGPAASDSHCFNLSQNRCVSSFRCHTQLPCHPTHEHCLLRLTLPTVLFQSALLSELMASDALGGACRERFGNRNRVLNNQPQERDFSPLGRLCCTGSAYSSQTKSKVPRVTGIHSHFSLPARNF